MTEPDASRPIMVGYGTLGPDEGSGLLPWSWAQDRLVGSHDYWVATRWPDGRPHVMPVWGVWMDDRLWFSSGLGSRRLATSWPIPAARSPPTTLGSRLCSTASPSA